MRRRPEYAVKSRRIGHRHEKIRRQIEGLQRANQIERVSFIPRFTRTDHMRVYENGQPVVHDGLCSIESARRDRSSEQATWAKKAIMSS